MKYQNIERVKVHNKYQSDEVVAIELISSGKTLPIYNYENMPLLLEKIVERIPDKSITEIKTPRIDWFNPWVMMASALIIGLVVIGIQSFDELTFELFTAIFVILNGLYLLFFKPLSKKSGINFRMFEIFLGTMMVIHSRILLYFNLF